MCLRRKDRSVPWWLGDLSEVERKCFISFFLPLVFEWVFFLYVLSTSLTLFMIINVALLQQFFYDIPEGHSRHAWKMCVLVCFTSVVERECLLLNIISTVIIVTVNSVRQNNNTKPEIRENTINLICYGHPQQAWLRKMAGCLWLVDDAAKIHGHERTAEQTTNDISE